jgi:peptidoglycan/LPS O-acetylase OafA/YrhL
MWKTQRFVFLDGLRGVAALAVAGLHAFTLSGADTSRFAGVALSVDFFFCLSGFVVACAYDERVGQMPFLEFVKKRAIRLYPMIFAGCVLGLIVAALVGKGEGAGGYAVAGALLLPAGLLANIGPYPINPPMWSLFFEVVASVIAYPLIVKHVPAKVLPWVLGSLGIALAGLAVAAGQVVTFGASLGVAHFPLGLLRVGFPFQAGMLIWRAYKILPHVRIPAWATLGALIAVLFMPRLPGVWNGAYQALAVVVLLPGVVFMGACAGPGLSKLWDALGRLSYPLYLVHWPVLIAVGAVLGGYGVAIPAGLVVAVATAWAILINFDEPIRARLGRKRRSVLGLNA